jgi:hypothetical protein
MGTFLGVARGGVKGPVSVYPLCTQGDHRIIPS